MRIENPNWQVDSQACVILNGYRKTVCLRAAESWSKACRKLSASGLVLLKVSSSVCSGNQVVFAHPGGELLTAQLASVNYIGPELPPGIKRAYLAQEDKRLGVIFVPKKRKGLAYPDPKLAQLIIDRTIEALRSPSKQMQCVHIDKKTGAYTVFALLDLN